MIRIENLNKYYNKGKSNELHVIGNTTVTFGDTGLVCILGESGSGKTTLMNTVSGLDDFESGSIEVDGVKIEKYGSELQEKVRNEKFGYIFQNYYLLMNRTVEYNLMLALTMYEVPEEEKEERIEYVLKAVDMWRYKKRLVSQLSGGQQQRIAIARALAKSPAIIFADEPTGNLDEANTMNIMGILKKISKNCLVVVVTHEKEIAQFFADRILWIRDGKIESERENESRTGYHYIDDDNLYLKEYEQTSFSKENAEIELYDHGEEHRLNLKLVYENGKVYISAGEDVAVEYLTGKSEKQVIDSERPVAKETDLEQTKYQLAPLGKTKKMKLTRKEIREIAKSDKKAMGKKKIVLTLTFLLMSILTMLSVEQITGAFYVDREAIQKTDSHYYQISVDASGYVSTKEMQTLFQTMLKNLEEQEFKIYHASKTEFSYNYEGFRQLENYTLNLPECGLVPLSYLEEDTLLYGEMPQKETEVVLDLRVVNKFRENSREAKSLITNANQMIGKSILSNQGISFKITGICDSGEPVIYLKEDAYWTVGNSDLNYVPEFLAQELIDGYETQNLSSTDSVIDVLIPSATLKNEYRKAMEKKYEDIINANENCVSKERWLRESDHWKEWGFSDREIREMNEEINDAKKSLQEELEKEGFSSIDEFKEMINSDTEYRNYTYQGELNSAMQYRVVGCFDNNEGVKYIVPNSAMKSIAYYNMSIYRRCNVYCDEEDIAAFEERLKEAACTEEITSKLKVTVVNQVEEDIQTAKEEGRKQLDSRILVFATLILISLIMLYFLMKSHAITGMQDLGVYRMLGISKRNIRSIYIYEYFYYSCEIVLPAVLLTAGITVALSNIESLGIVVICPWYAIAGTIVFLFACNILLAILPIRKMLKLPPAQLATKYDI